MTEIPARKGTHKAKALQALRRAGEDGVHINRLLKAVYGADDPALKPALGMVLTGIASTIKRSGAPVSLVRMKTNGARRYAIVAREAQ